MSIPGKEEKRKRYSVEEYVSGILAGDRTILSQAITLAESSLPEHYDTIQAIIEKCLPFSSKSIRIGITGFPGAGKSTFIESFGQHITGKGRKLAVLAIDPSSGQTKGSILGDKTRMEKLSTHPDAFIRPSPSAGTLGGVARKTRESIILCEAAGFDTIIVETVGVGQSETAVHSMVDFFLLLMLPGAGDELQGIKRGIIELADAIAITKADGQNKLNAETARVLYQNALQLFPAPPSGWKPEAVICSAFENNGIPEQIARRFQGAGLGETLRFAMRQWRVVGVMDAGNTGFASELWGDVETLLAAFRRTAFSSVILRLRDPAAFDALKARLETDPRLPVQVLREVEFYENQSRRLATFIRLLGLVLTGIFSLGAILGAMVTMYAQVGARIAEIGTLRALGFKRHHILAAFLLESMFLGFLGWLLGLVPASLLNFFTLSTINWSSFAEITFKFALTPGIVVKSLLFGVGMGLLGGLLPSLKAARLPLLEALPVACRLPPARSYPRPIF